MAPRELQLPGTRPTERMPTVDEVRIPPAGDGFYAVAKHRDDDDFVETHYASLERPCYCYGSGVVVLTVEEDGQEHDLVVPCRRCNRHHERG